MPGKTYDSVESIQEFFSKRNQQLGGFQAQSPKSKVQSPGATPGRSSSGERYATPQPFMPGSYVRHAKLRPRPGAATGRFRRPDQADGQLSRLWREETSRKVRWT